MPWSWGGSSLASYKARAKRCACRVLFDFDNLKHSKSFGLADDFDCDNSKVHDPFLGICRNNDCRPDYFLVGNICESVHVIPFFFSAALSTSQQVQ